MVMFSFRSPRRPVARTTGKIAAGRFGEGAGVFVERAVGGGGVDDLVEGCTSTVPLSASPEKDG